MIISSQQLESQSENLGSGLVIYDRTANVRFDSAPISVNKLLAEELVTINPKRRSLYLERCFFKVIGRFPDGCVIKDIDVMFNPDYQVDVLRILVDVRKGRNYKVIWSGNQKGGSLIYGEEGYLDYKMYEIDNYDITYVI